MKLDAARLPALIDDLDAAAREARAAFASESAGWSRGPVGKWTAGQHLAHAAIMLDTGAGKFEEAERALAAGTLAAKPWRDPIQALVMHMLTRERFPRGGRAPAFGVPGPTGSREQTLAQLDQGAARLRALTQRLPAADAGRIWIWNPYAPQMRWHYTLPEMLRVQASHIRHHLRMAREAAGI